MRDSMYPSKIDRWLVWVFAASSLLALAVCIPLLVYGPLAKRLVALPALLVGIGLPCWVMTTTAYTLTDYALVVRSGPFRWSLPLREIIAITPTKSALSSPALSLDRLRITYDHSSTIMISPDDRGRFLADLKSRGVAAAA